MQTEALVNSDAIDQLLQDLIDHQENKMLIFARELSPCLTSDDILQANDYPNLENHPHFRYLEGLVQGMQGAQMAIRAYSREREED